MAQFTSIVRGVCGWGKKIVGTMPATSCAALVLLAYMVISARVAATKGLGVDAFILMLLLFGFGFVCIEVWCIASVLRMISKHDMPLWGAIDKALALCISSFPSAVWIAWVYAMFM